MTGNAMLPDVISSLSLLTLSVFTSHGLARDIAGRAVKRADLVGLCEAAENRLLAWLFRQPLLYRRHSVSNS
jgi:hypothetical protein